MEDAFWAPRVSFRTPIPEVAIAADLLALAADSLLVSDHTQARCYLDQANMPMLRAYTRSIMSGETIQIHRCRETFDLGAVVPQPERGRRQPCAAMALDIYRRDGFRCRYCDCRIVFPQVQNVMAALLPGAVRWGRTDPELNAAFYTLRGVLDHVKPHSRGGTSEPDNLVVACQPCNNGKGPHFLQRFGLSDPLLRTPKLDGWDGLMRTISLRRTRVGTMTKTDGLQPVATSSIPSPKRPLAPGSVVSIDEFASSFSVGDRRCLNSLLQVVDACGDLGVSWKVHQVLLVKMQVGTGTIDVLGVERNATVQVPWSVGSYKREIRPFAETLAAALPGGTTYETKKMWRVRRSGHIPRISDLMHDALAVRHALVVLHRALNHGALESL